MKRKIKDSALTESRSTRRRLPVPLCLREKPSIKHLLLSAALLLVPLLAHADPAVSNVRASQRAGSNLVDIDFNLSGGTPPLSVSVQISSDNGATYTVPASSLSGHVGSNVAAGSNRKITWNVGVDWANQFSTGMKVKVTASDTPPAPTGMALIPAGNFSMGDAFLEGDSDENPVHTVTVSAFYMDKYEVSKALWEEVAIWAAANGYDISATSAGGKAANHPASSVTWYDAVKWCNARSQKEGLTPCYTVSGSVYKTGSNTPDCSFSANGYRLPTEAEWEKAARGGLSGKRFPWGDTISHSQANYFVYALDETTNWDIYDVSPTQGYHPTYGLGGYPYTSPVGSFSPNAYGLFDMAGNVWELCWDFYSEDFYNSSPNHDPEGPPWDSERIMRGGSWYGGAFHCRASYRESIDASEQFGDVGFRCARRPAVAVPAAALIPAGSFQMGDALEGGYSDELPVHSVYVSAFYMDKYEVSKALWDEVANWAASNGYDINASSASGKASNHPAYSVTWYDAVKWCNARSQKEGLTPCYTVSGSVYKTGSSTPDCSFSANGYRLPTEAEWEKAARGGLSGKRFPWGDTISHSQANYWVYSSDGTVNYFSYDVSPTRDYHPTYDYGVFPNTSPVGSFAPNGYGLYDMAGNLWEWCNDWYSWSYYSSSPGSDPRGPSSGSYLVLRGGGFASYAYSCRTAHRIYDFPINNYSKFYYGFRCARSSVP
jgi:formylglycine-generating enzyme